MVYRGAHDGVLHTTPLTRKQAGQHATTPKAGASGMTSTSKYIHIWIHTWYEVHAWVCIIQPYEWIVCVHDLVKKNESKTCFPNRNDTQGHQFQRSSCPTVTNFNGCQLQRTKVNAGQPCFVNLPVLEAQYHPKSTPTPSRVAFRRYVHRYCNSSSIQHY